MSIILKNDVEVLDPRLGYIPEIDERNLNFPISATITSDVVRNKTWTCPWFNQLNTSRCVAYSLGHELAATPVAIKNVTDSFMQTLYCEAQKIDPWPGSECGNNPPKYGGTSLLAGVKTLQSWGFFKEYRWANNALDMAKGIYTGPCVIGIRWYSDMTHPDNNGFIKPTGALQGGHAIFVRGVNAKDKYFILRNSWGNTWGKNGDCYLTFDNMDKLFAQGGECVFFLQRKYKNII